MDLDALWTAAQQSNYSPKEVEIFRYSMHRELATSYPWLAAEFFALEGMMGWGPGFRECQHDVYFPSMTLEAPQKMMEFLQLLEIVAPNTILQSLVQTSCAPDAEMRRLTSLERILLVVVTKARMEVRDAVINKLYEKIAWHRSHYTLGAARIFRSLWRQQECYALAAAGLIWLLHKPLSTRKVIAESIRRKHLRRFMETTTASSSQAQYFYAPVTAAVEQVVVQEVL